MCCKDRVLGGTFSRDGLIRGAAVGVTAMVLLGSGPMEAAILAAVAAIF